MLTALVIAFIGIVIFLVLARFVVGLLFKLVPLLVLVAAVMALVFFVTTR